ncbi:hypothetical protein HDU96_004733 [Phlyctochytrium bullatum]|nr:hypothetical protein HDU96_004733 [Phlyctochytrium bullatum]
MWFNFGFIVPSPPLLPFQSPFLLFKSFVAKVPLEDHKYHFKNYPRSFTTEIAQQVMVEQLNCSRDEAIEYLTRFLQAQVIQDLDKPKEAFELKPRHVYGLSSKGDQILKDIQSGRVPSDSPELVYSQELSALTASGSKHVSSVVRSNIIYLDRTPDGILKLGQVTAELVFRGMLGDKPNVGSRKTSEDAGEGGSAAVSPSRNGSVANLCTDLGITPIRAIQLHTRIVRLKSQAFTFTGNEAIDWILLKTSVMSRDEALHIASQFLVNGWIHVAGTSHNDPGTPLMPGDSRQIFKDAKSGVYQPTQNGCKLARWSVEFDVAKKKLAVRAEGLEDDDGRDYLSPTSPVDGESPLSSPSKSPSNRNSFYTQKDKAAAVTSNDNLTKPTAAEMFEWEVCHLNPISMDGSEGRAGTGGNKNQAFGSKDAVVTAASLAAAARSKRISHIGSGRSTSISGQAGTSAPRRASESVRPSASEDPNKANFSVDQIKESNPTRLVQILTNEDLRKSFHEFVRSMFCEENLYFWEDVHAFRTAYSGGIVIPGQALTLDQSNREPNPMLIPHAMALYLKYVVSDAPFELNIVIGIKKPIEAAIAQTSEFMQFIDPDSIASEDKIDPSKILVKSATALEKFPATLAGFTASMFDHAEHHIFQLMANDSVPKFIKTKMYADIMTELFVSGRIMWRGPASNGLLRRRSVEGTMDTLAGVNNDSIVVRRRSSFTNVPSTMERRKTGASIATGPPAPAIPDRIVAIDDDAVKAVAEESVENKRLSVLQQKIAETHEEHEEGESDAPSLDASKVAAQAEIAAAQADRLPVSSETRMGA